MGAQWHRLSAQYGSAQALHQLVPLCRPLGRWHAIGFLGRSDRQWPMLHLHDDHLRLAWECGGLRLLRPMASPCFDRYLLGGAVWHVDHPPRKSVANRYGVVCRLIYFLWGITCVLCRNLPSYQSLHATRPQGEGGRFEGGEDHSRGVR